MAGATKKYPYFEWFLRTYADPDDLEKLKASSASSSSTNVKREYITEYQCPFCGRWLEPKVELWGTVQTRGGVRKPLVQACKECRTDLDPVQLQTMLDQYWTLQEKVSMVSLEEAEAELAKCERELQEANAAFLSAQMKQGDARRRRDRDLREYISAQTLKYTTRMAELDKRVAAKYHRFSEELGKSHEHVKVRAKKRRLFLNAQKEEYALWKSKLKKEKERAIEIHKELLDDQYRRCQRECSRLRDALFLLKIKVKNARKHKESIRKQRMPKGFHSLSSTRIEKIIEKRKRHNESLIKYPESAHISEEDIQADIEEYKRLGIWLSLDPADIQREAGAIIRRRLKSRTTVIETPIKEPPKEMPYTGQTTADLYGGYDPMNGPFKRLWQMATENAKKWRAWNETTGENDQEKNQRVQNEENGAQASQE